MKARRQLCGLASVLGALVTVIAASATQPPESPSEVLARLPRTAELALVIDNLPSMLQKPGGKAMVQILHDLDVLEPGTVLTHWAPLAAELGWKPDEAFDRLLGSRVVLVMREVENAPARRWALMSEVTSDTEARITQRLALAPRKILASHPIYAVEAGRYELTSHRRPQIDRKDGRNVTLVLAESGRAELFDDLIEVLARGTKEPLSRTDVPKAAAALEPCDVVLAVRIDPDPPIDPAPAPGKDWSSFAVLGIRAAPHGLDGRVTLRDRSMSAALARIMPTADCVLGAIDDDALLAAVECRPSLGEGGGAAVEPMGLESVLGMLDPPAQVMDHLTGRIAILFQCVPAPVAAPNADAAGTGRGTLRILVGVESGDLETLAPLGDRCVAERINRVETHFGRPSQPVPEYAGIARSAIRQVRLDLPDESLPARVFGGPVDVAWTFACPKHPGRGVEECEEGGWWLASAGGESAACPLTGSSGCTIAMRRIAARLVEPGDKADVRRWFSIGVARPSRWPAALAEAGLPFSAGMFIAAARIKEASWRIWVTDTEELSGELRIEVSPASPIPAGGGGAGR